MKPKNRLSGYVDYWPREVGVLPPENPDKKQIMDAWGVVADYNTTFTFIESLHEAMQTLRRDPNAKPEAKQLIEKYRPYVEKMFKEALELARQISEDMDSFNLAKEEEAPDEPKAN